MKRILIMAKIKKNITMELQGKSKAEIATYVDGKKKETKRYSKKEIPRAETKKGKPILPQSKRMTKKGELENAMP